MCGINGILGNVNNSEKQLKSMNECILHRGPDSEGIWESEDGLIHLGHRRLAIIDLSPMGAQPMLSSSGNLVLIFNGEIYNYLEIRKELLQNGSGLQFRGNSDTELLLNCIEILGIEKTLSMIKGMFAFAVYDRKERKVTLARDRMGEKPLYYGTVKGRFVFSSDIRAIERVEGFDNEINVGILTSYFKGGYIPAPHTIYNDIYKLEPGTWLEIGHPYTEWKIGRYWDIAKVAQRGQLNPFKGNFEEAAYELERLITDSVKGQMISDVPLGAFLSGGIDSTLIVALMRNIGGKQIRTFTVGFEDEKYNEAVYAEASAKHLGVCHTQMYVTKGDILNVVYDIPKAFGEPFADSSQIPTMLVSSMTKKYVTVALSGDAGDEFFCGYNTYRDVSNGMKILQSKLGFIHGAPRKMLGSVAEQLKGSSNTMHKLAAVFNTYTAEKWYRNIREEDVWVNRLVSSAKTLKDKIDEYPDGLLNGNEPNLMLMDMQQYLPDDILVKVDRAGMLYSLESRIPLLDKDVMEFAWSLPQDYKYDGVTTKRILKNILYKYVPQEMMERPKKGFSVPLSQWLRGDELSQWAGSLIGDCRKNMGRYVDCNVIDKLWKRFLYTGEGAELIWRICVLSQWFGNHTC